MLDKNDIKVLKSMFQGMLKENNEVFGKDLKRDMRDEVHSLLSASEGKILKRMELLRLEMSLDMASFFDDRILPQIDRLDVRLNRVEKILKLA